MHALPPPAPPALHQFDLSTPDKLSTVIRNTERLGWPHAPQPNEILQTSDVIWKVARGTIPAQMRQRYNTTLRWCLWYPNTIKIVRCKARHEKVYGQGDKRITFNIRINVNEDGSWWAGFSNYRYVRDK